jgi:NADPH:quinone reductase-like Zn-dependent oxidoreductase
MLMRVASVGKHDFLPRRGVQGLIDSNAEGIVDRVKQLTGGRGVDLVLDARGGRSWRDSYNCLAPTGRLAVFGLATASARSRRKFNRLPTEFPSRQSRENLRAIREPKAHNSEI